MVEVMMKNSEDVQYLILFVQCTTLIAGKQSHCASMVPWLFLTMQTNFHLAESVLLFFCTLGKLLCMLLIFHVVHREIIRQCKLSHNIF